MAYGYGTSEELASTGVIALTTVAQTVVGTDLMTRRLLNFAIVNVTGGAVTFTLAIGGVNFIVAKSIPANSEYVWEVPLALNPTQAVTVLASANSSLNFVGNYSRVR